MDRDKREIRYKKEFGSDGLGFNGCLCSDSNSKPISSEGLRCNRHSEELDVNARSRKSKSRLKS